MPKLVVLLAVAALLLLLPGTAAAEGGENERFIKIVSTGLVDEYLDTESVKYIQDDDLLIAEATKKVIYSKVGVMSLIDKRVSAKLSTKGFEILSYALIKYQIVVDEPKWRITEAVFFSQQDKEFDRYRPHNPRWQVVSKLYDSQPSYDKLLAFFKTHYYATGQRKKADGE